MKRYKKGEEGFVETGFDNLCDEYQYTIDINEKIDNKPIFTIRYNKDNEDELFEILKEVTQAEYASFEELLEVINEKTNNRFSIKILYPDYPNLISPMA